MVTCTIVTAIISFIVGVACTRIVDWFLRKKEREASANERKQTQHQLNALDEKLWSMKAPWGRDTARLGDTDSPIDAVLSQDVKLIRTLTQAEYDEITTKDETTLYLIRNKKT